MNQKSLFGGDTNLFVKKDHTLSEESEYFSDSDSGFGNSLKAKTKELTLE
jgi:hypothetical protein